MNRYETKQVLGRGSFGCIYKGIDKKTNRDVAIKVDTDKPASFDQLKWEYSVYKEMGGTRIHDKLKWPEAYYFGKQPTGDSVMVMDLLGANLDTTVKKQDKLRPAQVAYFATQMLNLIKVFHNKGFIHRDLKPQNFVVDDSSSRYPELLLIDYGLVKKYWDDKSATHCPYLSKKGLKGTVRYTSVSTHLGLDQSRRDDLQSIGYILVYMTLGKVPWQSVIKSKDKRSGYQEIMVLKMKTKLEDLIKGIPVELERPLLNYLMYVNSLMFHESPNYEFMMDLFKPLLHSFNGISPTDDNVDHVPLEPKIKNK